MKKQIVNMQETNEELIITEKKEQKTYFVAETLQELLNKKAKQKTYLVCLNSKENIKTLIKNWNILIKRKEVTILFAHPENNEVWLINPTTHHNITEKESLEEGITALHTSISTIN
ncbi:hypothetical protein K9M74_02215 [Candidatus Woesearchaeota archaeon]|nr:hypothetical protein [Candidatus Woesearchaeota archaeon]